MFEVETLSRPCRGEKKVKMWMRALCGFILSLFGAEYCSSCKDRLHRSWDYSRET